MYPVTTELHDAKPAPQQAKSEPTREPATVKPGRQPEVAHPRPLVVEDDMATCG
jgi:hypothetical protein